jgi:hypothetical protein
MTNGPFSINGKTFTRTLNASEHVGRLIADIDGLLHTERDPAAMTNLLDERSILYTARETLVGSMCEACKDEAPEQPAAEPAKMLGVDFLILDAMLDEINAKILTAVGNGTTGNELSGLNFRREALSRVLGLLREVAKASRAECPPSDDSAEGEEDKEDSVGPTHDDLEGAVNLAEDASTAEGHDGDFDYDPEYQYEEACLDRVRKTVFRMAGLVPEEKTMADTDKIEWDTLGPAAVVIDRKLIVAWPLEGTDQYPRSAEIGSVLVIPIKHVVPRA